MTEDDFEILEPKDYTGKRDENYSHGALVMSALKDCKDNRAKEMRDGYYQTKFDRLGNAHKVWVIDSRQVFIESVESLMMIQERDYDDKIISEINKIKEWLKIQWIKLCNLEEEEWRKMPYDIKKQKSKEGFYFMSGELSDGLPYFKMYTRYKVNAYTKIVAEIQKLIKRLGDYQEEMYEA